MTMLLLKYWISFVEYVADGDCVEDSAKRFIWVNIRRVVKITLNSSGNYNKLKHTKINY